MKYFTMIGSRETPVDVQQLMIQLAGKLSSQGWTGRSGGADAADKCLELGCQDSPEMMEIYLPWNGFNRCSSTNVGYIDTPKLPTYKTALSLAEELHPNWGACSRGARGLHTRNCYQVLGKDLKTPSRFVVCWAIPTGQGDNCKGGTGQALRLAIREGVEIINLYHNENLQRIKDWINI